MRAAWRSAAACRATSATVAPVCVGPATSVRMIIQDSYYNYLDKMKVVQTNNVDSFMIVKNEQYDWQVTQQWAGYSDTYLARHLRYVPSNEQGAGAPKFETPVMDKVLDLCYNIHGRAADILEDLEGDVLQKAFHEKLAHARTYAKEFEAEIDKFYAPLHPTFKTLADAWLVRRHFALQDWFKLVEKKRRQTLERLSPEFIEQQEKLKGIAASHMRNLRRVGEYFEQDHAFPLTEAYAESGLTEEEFEIVRQKATYHRRRKNFGKVMLHSDQYSM